MSECLHKVKIIALVVLPLMGVGVAMFLTWNRYFFWSDLWIVLGMYIVTTMGVTIGFHRMLTHQGFEAPGWLRAFILICGSMAYDGSPAEWAATHIVHHAHSDEDGDPHSPLHGFWHAHFGWLFSCSNFYNPRDIAPRITDDPVVRYVNMLYPLWLILALAIPFALGGWTGLVWGGAVRICLTTHVTWSVNSICHTFGRRPFETNDASRNHWVIGLLGFGEGWHNNHHAFPENAFHGLKWWQVDMSGVVIRILEKVGLIWNVQRVSDEMMAGYKQQTRKRLMTIADLKIQLFDAIEHTEKEIRLIIDTSIKQALSTFDEKEYRKNLERILEIREAAMRATIIKKQRLMTYLQEVQKIGAFCRS